MLIVRALMLAALAVPAQAGEMIYATPNPAGHVLSDKGIVPYADTVRAATNGDIDIQIQPGGVLAGHKQMVGALGTGAVDFGGGYVDFHALDVLPTIATVTDMSVLGKDLRVMTAAANENLLLGCPKCKQEYLDAGVIPMVIYSTPTYKLICREPVKSAADMAGKKVRGLGAMGRLAASLDATPVNITIGEAYEAIQRGAVDCLAVFEDALKLYSFWDVSKNVVDLPLGTVHGAVALSMSKKLWDGMSDAEHQALTAPLAKLARNVAESYTLSESEIRTEAKDHGVEYIQPDETLIAAVNAFAQSDAASIAEVAKGRGVENPEQLIADFEVIVDKWAKIVEGIGTGEWGEAEWDKYEQALQDEIYSKVTF